MRPHAIALVFLLIFSPISHAQTVTGQHPDRTTAQLGTASTQAGLIFNHTQGADATDCTVGGGAFEVPCWSNGTTWVALTATGASSEINDLEATDPPTILDTEIYIGTGAATGAFAAVSGDATMANTGALTIGADKILESHLKAVDAPADEEVLTYESTTGDFEWQASAGGAPGGSDTQLQYNNAGVFGGTNMTYDGTDSALATGQLLLLDGSVSVPSIAWSDDPDSGLFSITTGAFSFTKDSKEFNRIQGGNSPFNLFVTGGNTNDYAEYGFYHGTTASKVASITSYGASAYKFISLYQSGREVVSARGNTTARPAPITAGDDGTNHVVTVQATSSQTIPPFVVESSAGVNWIEVTSSGDVDIATGDLSVTAGKATVGDILTITPKASAPATCSIGEFYVDTSGAACACSATNTWSNMHATGTCV